MTSPSASDPVLRRLLEAAGYRLEDRRAGLRAHRARDHRSLLVVRGQPSPVDLASEFGSEAVRRTVVYDADPGPVARALAAEHGIEVLDPESLGSALGELLLPPMAPAGPEPAASPRGVEAPHTMLPDAARTVRLRVGRDDAEIIAGIDGFRLTLRLIPFQVAPYRVRMASAHGEPGPMSDHLVAVNALSGRVEVWEPGERELVGGTVEPHQRLEPVLSEEESRTEAEAELRRRHSVSVDHTEQHGGALVIERRRVPPGPSDLRIGSWAQIWVPYWYAEGPSGRIVIDAVSGARSPADAGLIERAR